MSGQDELVAAFPERHKRKNQSRSGRGKISRARYQELVVTSTVLRDQSALRDRAARGQAASAHATIAVEQDRVLQLNQQLTAAFSEIAKHAAATEAGKTSWRQEREHLVVKIDTLAERCASHDQTVQTQRRESARNLERILAEERRDFEAKLEDAKASHARYCETTEKQRTVQRCKHAKIIEDLTCKHQLDRQADALEIERLKLTKDTLKAHLDPLKKDRDSWQLKCEAARADAESTRRQLEKTKAELNVLRLDHPKFVFGSK